MRKKLTILAVSALISSVALASFYPIFGPVTGILKGNSGSPQTSAAVSSDVVALFSGCSGSLYLGADGTCHAASGLSPLTTLGDIWVFGTSNTRLPVGTNGQVLSADSTQTTGLKWAAGAPLSTKGDLFTFSTTNARLPVGTDGQVLSAASSQTTGLQWVAGAPVTTKGDIFTFSTVNAALPVGTDGQVLSANSSQATGLQWVAGSPLTTKGDLFTFSTVNARLAKGTDGYVLTADSTQTTGLSWTPNGTFVPVPASVPDLALWFKADGIKATNGQALQTIPSATGGVLAGWPATTPAATWTVSSALLNGLTTIDVTSPGQDALLNNVMFLGGSNGCTFFLVFKQTSGAGVEGMVGGATHSIGFYTSNSNNKISLVDVGSAVLVSATTAWTNATWTQVNMTYNASTGAYAFRQARAANGSGTTSTIAVNGRITDIFAVAGTSPFLGSVAELIIYSRVLSGGEITTVENYLNSKWGV